ncbi:hypothetical protein L195_g060537 [Trifolium pratense]|uniref:Uncharacterized protein n=1 Tax=Trifolium pratense TaxID=57577 RepID=A0A2K3K4G1_TRIPR|nr:hypothetical protein L195_g060537 [Trifolium pratense]
MSPTTTAASATLQAASASTPSVVYTFSIWISIEANPNQLKYLDLTIVPISEGISPLSLFPLN